MDQLEEAAYPMRPWCAVPSRRWMRLRQEFCVLLAARRPLLCRPKLAPVDAVHRLSAIEQAEPDGGKRDLVLP
jgi:hypothetical protein